MSGKDCEMSLLSNFTFVATLVIINILCGYVPGVNGNNSDRSWPKLQNQQNAPSSNWVVRGGTTTPWPALGQPRNRPIDNISINPTWVRPNQRENYNTMSFRNQAFSNSNVRNTGSQYGSNRRVNTNQNLTPLEVRDDELREFSEALLNKDVNNAAKYVTINVQSKTTSRSDKDEAPLPLLSIDSEALKIPSIEKMLLLHNNYVIESNVNEDYTPQEKNEENNLLDTIINTSIMQDTRNFLIQKGVIGQDPKEFRDTLYEIWFNMYSRGNRKVGSSGFEHVFLAEIKNNQISGLHNWLYFNEEEKNNRANYLGYMKKIDLGNKGAILKYHFTLRGIDKPVGSMFIGTSPEFEIALYTTCFLLRADQICPLKLNGNRFIIRTFTFRYRGKKMIGSAFPEI